jgi:hypothetical protein
MTDSRLARWGEHAGSVRGPHEHAQAQRRRKQERTRTGRRIAEERLQDRAKKRVITPIFSIKYLRIQVSFLRLLYNPEKRRTTTPTCEEASVNKHPMTQGKRATKRKCHA